ncbi:actin cytoskeleton-regulatory complex PAN1-like, partial [Brachionus plicatilis]
MYEPYEDLVEAKYEREMGSELAKPSSKTNYSDSYFYSSSVHNYPTIDDQKKLAKTIAETLEGSNPATSKYHLKKQKFQKQSSRDGYDSEGPRSAPHYSTTGHDFFPSQEDPKPANSFIYDESLPDIIKRSIAQASMNDPVRLVVAPDSFKSQHYTEHTTHTQMPPRAAMSLAAALENTQSKGGRGAQIFQRRKEKSEKWIIDENNVKRVPGQPPLPKPQPQVYLP